jgi:plastocyanin
MTALPGAVHAALDKSTNIVDIAASPSGMLMYTKSKLTAKAGKVTIAFTNTSPLAHDVALINSANKSLGQTPSSRAGRRPSPSRSRPAPTPITARYRGHREASMQGTLTVTS